MICNQGKEQVRGYAKILYHDFRCTIYELEKGTPAWNRAERAINIVNDRVKDDMFSTKFVGLFMVLLCRKESKNNKLNSTIKPLTPELDLT